MWLIWKYRCRFKNTKLCRIKLKFLPHSLTPNPLLSPVVMAIKELLWVKEPRRLGVLDAPYLRARTNHCFSFPRLSHHMRKVFRTVQVFMHTFFIYLYLPFTLTVMQFLEWLLSTVVVVKISQLFGITNILRFACLLVWNKLIFNWFYVAFFGHLECIWAKQWHLLKKYYWL